jgi:2,3-bisphosphoglycerate-dependent phosphoglycerate mutase
VQESITNIFFIRHAESDITVHDGRIRPLTKKGLNDCNLVTKYLDDKKINVVLSSPFKRAIDTVADFAQKNNFKIQIVEDFCERKSDSDWNRHHDDFFSFIERQWADFNYTSSDGECLAEVQERNITALKKVLVQYKGKNIVIGTHGTALSTIINYYDNKYDFNDFMEMVNIMPWVVKMSFDEYNCIGIDKINLFL